MIAVYSVETCVLASSEIRKRRVHRHWYSNWRWRLDEVFVRINGETHYLSRAVDHEGEMLEVFATKRRDRRAALRFLKRAMKRYGRPASVVTDGLPSYRAAMNVIGNAAAQTCGRWLSNRAETHINPFGDENAQWQGSRVKGRCRNLPQSTLQFDTSCSKNVNVRNKVLDTIHQCKLNVLL